MCGRYVLKAALPDIARMLGMDVGFAAEPRYNIAPMTPVPVGRMDSPGEKALALVRWGLIPRWAKQADSGYRMINARAESVAEKPAFRAPFRQRRCLVPADGYYEWKSVAGRKQPYYFHMNDGEPFCFAGLWERWQPEDGEPIDSCAIITTAANALGAEIHPRMPVILPSSTYAQWLDPTETRAESLLPLLTPFPPEAMAVHPVSTLVNNARVDEPRCIEPLVGDPL